MRTIGIDPGTRRIGVAVSDEDGSLAHARTTLDAGADASVARAIADLAAREGAAVIVVGLPLGLDGREGASARRSRALAKAIERAAPGLEVVLFDERLTTASAHRTLAAAGVGGRKRRELVDQVAAAVLLQAYLDMRAARGA